MRYIIAVDLGTTNSSVHYIDTQDALRRIKPFAIPQLTAPGQLQQQSLLPSCCYIPAAGEIPKGAVATPWRREAAASDRSYIVGTWAQELGGKVPTRLVASAKSWLCHAAALRKDKVLPVAAADPADRISAVTATTRYLRHILEAWNHRHASEGPESFIESQDVVVTVPASFDEAARALTAAAAKDAGFNNLTLLEEPQAAFYAWIHAHERAAREKFFRSGDVVLVCDVGGGTTDFSLIRVEKKKGEDSALSFVRHAVGDHLLLGGDNIDAALAALIESKLGIDGGDLGAVEWQKLCHIGRKAKEALLGDDATNTFQAAVQGSGSKVIAKTKKVSLKKNEVVDAIVNGFFPVIPWSEATLRHPAAAIKTMGLPYEEDAAITRHLAHFLSTSNLEPDFVLFNGGTMKPQAFQKPLLEALKLWFPEKEVQLLHNDSMDSAVSRGAAYYGSVRKGLGIRIGGGLPRSYYLEIESKNGDAEQKKSALTLLERGTEEGYSCCYPDLFRLKPNMPIAFSLHSSHVRIDDKQGDIVAIDDEQMQPLPPIHTVMRWGKGEKGAETIPVQLSIHLNAIGTIELWLKSAETDHRWNLEFQIRSAAGHDYALQGPALKAQIDSAVDEALLQQAQEAIKSYFIPAPGETTRQEVKIVEQLEATLRMPRSEWSPSTLRALWKALSDSQQGRKRSTQLQGRWWNLAGFCLRPGYGYALDDWRMKELWKVLLADLSDKGKTGEHSLQRWICCRRVAGGLNKGQQRQLAAELSKSLFNPRTGKIESKSAHEHYLNQENIRTLASLELIDPALKVKLGEALLHKIKAKKFTDTEIWALGRLGARHLFHGSTGDIVVAAVAEKWVDALLSTDNIAEEALAIALGLLSYRTDLREINLSKAVCQKVDERFAGSPHKNIVDDIAHHHAALSSATQNLIFGETLPPGLSLP